MLQQIFLLPFDQNELIWRGREVAITTIKEQCRGKEENQILLLATDSSTQNVQAATREKPDISPLTNTEIFLAQ